MRALYTAAEIRAAEEPRAGRDARRRAHAARRDRPGDGLPAPARQPRTADGSTLLVGTGNNGGDALFAGAALAGRGARVTAVLLDAGRAHPAGLAALRRAGGRVVDAGAGDTGLDRADLVIDGMLGIGGRGGLRPDAAALARAAAEGAGITVAVDVPSGVDADTGAVDGRGLPGHAHRDLRRGQARPGRRRGPRPRRAGAPGRHRPGPAPAAGDGRPVHRRRRRRAGCPLPSAGDDKYSQGVVGIVAGSATYPGPAVLCTGAALRTRPGLVRYAGTAADGVRAAWPEAIVTDGRPCDAGRVQAWVVGPGDGHGRRRPRRAGRGAGHRPPGARRRRRAHPAGRGPGPGPRPHGADPAHPARPRVRPVRDRASAPTAWARPAGSPPTWAAPSC